MANEALTEVKPGDLLAGKYRLERILGRGGMGVVVSALHEQLDERVALKFLLPEALENAEAVARFLREARAAVKIRSEHVARVTDVGTLESGSPYMVMEYLEGMDLARYVESRGPLPVEEAVEYVLQACEALAEAHSIGIVHRDLKPANLFRTERADGSPSIKLLDFGISKVITQDGAMTRTSSMMGSPLYMAPEQMTSAKHVDARADVWALGVILHELLTGEVPFSGDTIPELCAKILTEPPQPIRELRADISEELEQVILGCLQRERERRYGSVAELAIALRPFAPSRALVSVDRVSRMLGGERVPAGAPVVAAQTNAETSTQAAWGATGETSIGSRRARKLWIGGAAGLALAAAALLAMRGTTVSEVDGATAAAGGLEPAQEPSALSAPPPAPVDTRPQTDESAPEEPEPSPPADDEVTDEPAPSPPVQVAPTPQKTTTKSVRPAAAPRPSPGTGSGVKAKPAPVPTAKATAKPTDFYLDRK